MRWAALINTTQSLHQRLMKQHGTGGGKIVRSRGLGYLLRDSAFLYIKRKRYAHEISTIWPPKQGWYNDSTSWHTHVDGGNLTSPHP